MNNFIKKYKLNLILIVLPTVLVFADDRLSIVSIASIIIGLVMFAFLGLKGQITKHKHGIFAHLTSPGEFLKLKLTPKEITFFWIALSIFVGGLLALGYLLIAVNIHGSPT